MERTQKRRKYSKKRKANLRKYTNIRDVEEYVEDLSRQQRTGGVVADKTDAELFTIETSGVDASACKETPSYKRLWRPLKCEANLMNQSKVEAVVGRKPKSLKNRMKGKSEILSKKRSSNMKHTAKNGSTGSDTQQQSQLQCSLWSTTVGKFAMNDTSFICKCAISYSFWYVGIGILYWDNGLSGDDSKELDDDYYNQVTGRKRVKKPPSMDVHKRASLLPAVDVAHPGASYNPSFVDHQDLLHKAVAVETEKQKKTESLHRTFSLPSMSHKERVETWHEEMSKGLFNAESSSDEGIGSDGEGVDIKAPVLADRRKAKKTRRKEAERKTEELKKMEKKKEALQQNEVYRLRSIVKELQHKEASMEAKKKLKQVKEQNGRLQAKRLGKLQYVEPDIDVQLSEEITGSLRTLKPEGNILRERLKSLQKRNRIEPRKTVMPYRRYKLKEKEKWSCK